MYLIREFITEEHQETRLVIGYTYDLETAVESVKLNYGEPSSVESITGGNVLYYDKNGKRTAFWIREVKSIQKGDKF